MNLNRVMVLKYEPDLTHSVWVDYFTRCRSRKSLLKLLRKEVKAGNYVGYRLITVRREVYGVE